MVDTIHNTCDFKAYLWNLYQFRQPIDLTYVIYNTFPCYYCCALDPRMAEYEALKTGYFLKDSINMVLVTGLRVLNMKI